MNDKHFCPNCGAALAPEQSFCPNCGTALAVATDYHPETGAAPRTIEELRLYCEYHHMPLEKMRFFVGVDYKQPRAFGIYRDGGRYVVYKNKDNGSRAVRYDGPDEAYAVNELYAKLLDECHKRNIWPGGKPKEVAEREKKSKRNFVILVVVLALAFAVFSFLAVRHENRVHAHDGYYRFNDDALYYRYGDDWYYDDYYYDWVIWNSIPYDDYESYYIGSDYDDGWGYSDFAYSDAWESIQDENRTSSSDYDSWDSGGTDWSSDW
ncbi:MAG: zinc-ribbon domain-containing protein [Clostridia bacterium]|nr:zinc-ribbon domain-containing protein [Clostridia bacterium]